MSKKLPDLYFTEHYCEIPEIFFSSDISEPFSVCTMCNRELIKNNTSYIIEKAIKNYPETQVKDIIFEYAMCIECLEKLRKNFSSESIEKINNYIMDKTDLSLRRNRFIKLGNLNVDDWLSTCIVKDISQNELPEFQIMCQCQGAYMLYTYMPYMLSCDASEEMQELLSKKTKDELDRFYNENLGIPPELKELFKTKTPIF